ncbi:MAG: alginate lyase family protein [Bacteriovoracaceae bacterium]|nr:alginate lyase family protein [Bacteriovoracaceae bacterium]
MFEAGRIVIVGKITKIFFTLYYLKPVQIYGRIIFLFKRKFVRVGDFCYIAVRARELKASLTGHIDNQLVFNFLNLQRSYQKDNILWKDVQHDKLWRYNLNYFDFLNNNLRYSFDTKIYLILDWIEKNTNERSETWEPYVISKRVVNWIKALNCELKCLSNEFKQIVAESVFDQCKRLFCDIEYHIQANHLLENLKALFISSIFLLNCASIANKKTVIKWLDFSTKKLLKQLEEQIFEDGAHYELSPMYHEAIMLGVLEIKENAEYFLKEGRQGALDINKIESLQSKAEEVLPKMKEWLLWMKHPDGEIALFNDSALKVSTSLLKKAGVIKKVGWRFLKESGYFVKGWGNGNYFVMDCGDISPAYQPAHSHCDTLSYELSVNGRRIIVDTGCGSYQDSEIRQECRNTSAHNVPMVEQIEQSEMWGTFRVGRRSRVINGEYNSKNNILTCRLKDYHGNVFLRGVSFVENLLIIKDSLERRICKGIFLSLIHVNSYVDVKKEDNSISLEINGLTVRVSTESRCEIRDSFYYPEFGKREENKIIVFYSKLLNENEIQYTFQFNKL